MRLQKYSISKAIPTFPHYPATLFLQMGKKEKPTGKGMGKKKKTRENIEKSEKITSFILPKHQISKNIRILQDIYNHISFMPRQIKEDIKEIIKLKNIIYDRY